jgi:tetratricopeptide (TPR) repeat protein
MRVRGDWGSAEDEARRASRICEGRILSVAAEAYYLMGEICLRRGAYEKAESLFQESHQRGRQPIPGLALLRLAQGRNDAAKSLLDRALSTEAVIPRRIRLLFAGVEISLATGDVPIARERAEEIESLAEGFESTVFSGFAKHAIGAVADAEGDVETAMPSYSAACQHWQAAEMPYEEARTRILLAAAHWKSGETDLAGLEARSARGTFERLGARRTWNASIRSSRPIRDRTQSVDGWTQTRTGVYFSVPSPPSGLCPRLTEPRSACRSEDYSIDSAWLVRQYPILRSKWIYRGF